MPGRREHWRERRIQVDGRVGIDHAHAVGADHPDACLAHPIAKRLLSHAAEERAQKLVAIQFFLLAPYVTFEAVHKLWTAEQPETSWLGIALVSSSVIGMPFLGIAKRRLADKLGSVATRGEGTQLRRRRDR